MFLFIDFQYNFHCVNDNTNTQNAAITQMLLFVSGGTCISKVRFGFHEQPPVVVVVIVVAAAVDK